MKKDKSLDLERWKKMIRAGAVGDAFGYQVEFSSWEEIKSEYGDLGIRTPPQKEIPISDDTQMTLFSIEGSLKWYAQGGRHDGSSIIRSFEKWNKEQVRAYLNWYETQHHKKEEYAEGLRQELGMYKRQAPGITCLKALESIKQGDLVENESKGCGGVMRVGGAVLIGMMDCTPNEVWNAGVEQAFITHRHWDGVIPAGVLAYILCQGPSGIQDLEAILIKEVLPRLKGSEATGTIRAIENCLKFKGAALTPEEITEHLGEGWTGDEALAIGLWSAFRAQSLFSAIVLATNHNGDSDSTATIAGQLAALMHPWDEECERTYQKLDLRSVIERTLQEVELGLKKKDQTPENKMK